VNDRLNKIANDSIFTNHLTLMKYLSNDSICPLANSTLDRNKLPNLRCFSLHCDSIINDFEQLILTLKYRMSNLEKLELNVNISMTTTIIDGNYLKTNILNHMIQLDKFTFNIHSWFGLRNQFYFPSNENIQHAFNNFKNKKIISCIDYYLKNEYGQCHIYSYPYRLKYYKHITNNFSGGLFKYSGGKNYSYDFFFDQR
ncbi:unnamed protein product, partial [Rotaria sordida]